MPDMGAKLTAKSESPGPDLSLESSLWSQGHRLVCGVDEVGRGPLAGPVVAAAVLFTSELDPAAPWLARLDDSKKLKPAQRQQPVPEINAHALGVGIGIVSPQEIDRINIRQAALSAMAQAVAKLPQTPDYALVDGRDLPEALSIPAQAVIGGDARSIAIAAASIVAKVHRDGIMAALAREHPAYGWERNQGYPTKEHRDALLSFGVTQHHRRSFGPVKKALG